MGGGLGGGTAGQASRKDCHSQIGTTTTTNKVWVGGWVNVETLVQKGMAMRETKRGGFSCSPLILSCLPKLADLRQTLDHVSITAGYDVRGAD